MDQSLIDAAKTAVDQIDAIHKAFGAPGDYGYGTKKGQALFDLYQAAFTLSLAINAVTAENKNA